LYRGDWEPRKPNKRDEGVIECLSDAFVGKNVVFLSEGSNKVKPRTAGLKREDVEGNYLVFFGEPTIADTKRITVRSEYRWAIEEIYIEKFYDGEKYYIYISKIDETDPEDPANKRKTAIDLNKEKGQ
jgi:hypothetical protein